MKHVSHLLLAILVLAIFGVGATRVFAIRDEQKGQSLAHWFLREMRRSEALDQRAAEMVQLLEVKKAIIGDLVAERLTLREAAEEFRQADQSIENDRAGLVASYHMPETEEGLYKQVLIWTKSELSAAPEQAKQVIPRLEQELAEECRGEGNTE